MFICPDGFPRIKFCWQPSTFFRLSVSLNDNGAGEMESPLKSSSKSHRAREFLPSVKPSYLSLILIFVCTTNLLRNESTSDRLLALEEQIKTLSSSKSSVKPGSQANYEDMSGDEQIAESVILVRKIGKPEKKLYYSTGKINSTEKYVDCSRTVCCLL